MKRFTGMIIVLAGVMGSGLWACAGGEETPPAGDVHGDMPMGEGMEGMQGHGMQGMEGMHDMAGMSQMMKRHAEEADSMAAAIRDHVRQMRELPADQWHDRMGEHVGKVSQMLGLMNRHMREMGMGMDMSDERMGEMMGMSGEEHRRMMEDMQALRADLEQLQTASRDEVRDRMPGHLDALEEMAGMMEESAAHMRSM